MNNIIERTRKNNCIARSLKPTKEEVAMFAAETLVIDPFWDDLLNYKQWKKRKK